MSLTQSIDAKTKPHLRQLLPRLFPAGQIAGVEFLVRNPNRNDAHTGSLKFNLESGAWSDFATGHTGGGLTTFVRFMLNCNAATAAAQIRAELNALPPADQSADTNSTGDDTKVIRVMPVANPPTSEYLQAIIPGQAPDHCAWYRDDHGQVIFGVMRWNAGTTTDKRIRPLLPVCDADASHRWIMRHHPEPRPIYGRERLMLHPTATVVVVEGEMKADILQELAPEVVVVTWPGGANAAHKADWLVLRGRRVVIWPDADQVGVDAASSLAATLRDMTASCALLDLTTINTTRQQVGERQDGCTELELPAGWDAADAAHEGWTHADIRFLLAHAQSATQATRPMTPQPNRLRMTEHGLIYEDGSDQQAVTGRFEILAEGRDPNGIDWSWWLSFADRDGRSHTVVIPKRQVASDGAEIVATLRDHGLDVEPGIAAQRRLIAYLLGHRSSQRMRLIDQVGWHEGVYLLGDAAGTVIGTPPANEVIQLQRTIEQPTTMAGDLVSWRSSVAQPAIGNSRLGFALSCACAAPLLNLLGAENALFHLRGSSSTGKTTAMHAAGSVFGTSINSWRATANGLEAIAAASNDHLLLLDELGQADPTAVGACVYTIANGTGKMRMTRDLQNRPTKRWRCLALSSGEQSLANAANEGGKRIHAGQELRLIDIPADAGSGHGTWEALHGAADGAAFSHRLRGAATAHKGVAGPAWVAWIVAHRADIVQRWPTTLATFRMRHLPPGASGQVMRTCDRFALVAYAGTLATEAGIFGWPPDEAEKAARACFTAWLTCSGAGSAQLEETQAIAEIRGFILRHGAARFSELTPNTQDTKRGLRNIGNDKVVNRVGWKVLDRLGGDAVEYWLTAEGWKEACNGIDPKQAVHFFRKRGMLKTEGSRNQCSRRIPSEGHTAWVYVIRASALDEQDTPHVRPKPLTIRRRRQDQRGGVTEA